MPGGAIGVGLWGKIKEACTKIAHVYEKGDSVYLFGFSRGALKGFPHRRHIDADATIANSVAVRIEHETRTGPRI